MIVLIQRLYAIKKEIKIASIQDEKNKVIPKIGEEWLLSIKDKSPWDTTNKYPPVTILDVKDGWVRYSFVTIFTDQRMEIESFLGMYKPYLSVKP